MAKSKPTGLLWHDDSPDTSFENKVRGAIQAYHRKFEALPTVVYVHPDSLNQSGSTPAVAIHMEANSTGSAAAVLVLPGKAVLRHTFFVVEEKDERPI